MPAQPIAASTSRKAVLRGLCAALITLDDMIHFPVSIGLFIPAPVFKLDPVTAKVAMSGCLVVNLQQLTLTHSWLPSSSCKGRLFLLRRPELRPPCPLCGCDLP